MVTMIAVDSEKIPDVLGRLVFDSAPSEEMLAAFYKMGFRGLVSTQSDGGVMVTMSIHDLLYGDAL
jgi:hypothetical protein